MARGSYLHPRAKLGYFPCYSEGNEVVVLDPEDRETVLERLVFPRQPKHDRICLADFYRPKDSGELDVVALQAVTAGDEVTELMARLEADGEFAEQLFTHGLGVQTAEGIAEWLHACARRDLGIDRDQGRRYSWGYPACPEQSEHEKVFRLLDAPSIGLRLSGGYAVEPEQSTIAIVAHHPQAVYFGMKSGFLPKNDRQARDELIAGTDRDPASLDAPLPESDPAERGEPALSSPSVRRLATTASTSACQPSVIVLQRHAAHLALVEELLRSERREQRVREVLGPRRRRRGSGAAGSPRGCGRRRRRGGRGDPPGLLPRA